MENLAPVLIDSPKSEILVVQTKVGPLNIRIINAYGPQESENKQVISEFWQGLEKQVISAKDNNCCVLVQIDANAKLGKDVIPGDPHDRSANGQLLLDLRGCPFCLFSQVLANPQAPGSLYETCLVAKDRYLYG